jgi:hypothetical protein
MPEDGPLYLAMGRHGPITLCVERLTQDEARIYWPFEDCAGV